MAKGTLLPIPASHAVYLGISGVKILLTFMLQQQLIEQVCDRYDLFSGGDRGSGTQSPRLATGGDGIQRVCRNVVFLQLPWTSTEYEQAVGRYDRDGCLFEDIDIHIPLTVVANGREEWSWCRSKLDRIRSKKDIARASVDGEIGDSKGMLTPPEGHSVLAELVAAGGNCS